MISNKIPFGKKAKLSLAFVAFFTILMIHSCQYDFIEVPQPPPPNPVDTVSFANEIETIFNDNSNCTACHNTGGQSPDLTTGNAYNSITTMSLVDTANPETSLIYWEPNPNNDAEHTWKKYTESQSQLVLQWINQGALNN